MEIFRVAWDLCVLWWQFRSTVHKARTSTSFFRRVLNNLFACSYIGFGWDWEYFGLGCIGETRLEFRLTNTCSHAGSSNVETAVNWIVEHENDSDIDEMPLVWPWLFFRFQININTAVFRNSFESFCCLNCFACERSWKETTCCDANQTWGWTFLWRASLWILVRYLKN